MRICPHCKAIVEDGEKFCSNCGFLIGDEAAPKRIRCLKCGTENSSACVYCINCGESLDEAKAANQQNADAPAEQNPVFSTQTEGVPPTPPAEPVPPAAPAEPAAAAGYNAAPVGNTSIQTVKPAKKSSPDIGAILKDKKKLPIIIAAIAALGVLLIVGAIVITVLIIAFTSGGRSDIEAIYMKDEELYYPNYNSSEGWEITSDFAGSSDMSSSSLASRAADVTSYKVQVTKDRKYIFFPDKLTGSSYYSIYFRRLNSDDEAHKMDSDVISYHINDNGSTVVYLKDNNNSLYTYSMSKDNSEKIGTDVSDYSVSADCRTVVFLDNDNTFYFWEEGKEKEKIDRDVSAVYFTDDYLRTMYYLKDGTLYKKTMGQEKEKVSDDVSSILGAYSSGDIYYTKSVSGSGSDTTYYDMLEDDLAEADEGITRPEMPSRPYRSYYSSNDEYQKANDEYLAAYDKYEEDYKKYSQKEARDRIRESLKSEYYYDSPMELYFYNGSETAVSKNVSGSVRCAEDAPVASFVESTSSKVLFSEVYSEDIYASDIRSKITEANSGTKTFCIASRETVKSFDLQYSSDATFNSNGSAVYFTAVTKEEAEDLSGSPSEKTLYRVNVSGSSIGDAVEYDKDVFSGYVTCYGDDKVVYYKDADTSGSFSTGTMFANKTKVDDDVLMTGYNFSNNNFIYYKDISDSSATVKIFYGDRSEKINDDVYAAYMLSDGAVVYLHDYSTRSGEGDLYIFRNGRSSKIDTDVMSLAVTSERRVSRYLYRY